MAKSSQYAGIGIVITFFLSFSAHIYEAQASEVKTWVRGAAEIMVDKYENERPFCGGKDYNLRMLTEGRIYSERYKYYNGCPFKYDMTAEISFDSPPRKIAAGESVQLKANGTKSGYQDCCFVPDEFSYGDSGICASLTSERIYLSLRSLHDDPEPITIPGVDDAMGWQGTVSDDIDVVLTMSTIGTECTVTGRTNDGLWLRWVYQMQVEQVSDVIIDSIVGPTSVFCDDTKDYAYGIALTNTGSETDTGTIHISTDLEGALFHKSMPYSLAGGASKNYGFPVRFPREMYVSSGEIRATLTSDNGSNDSKASLEIRLGLGCKVKDVASAFLMFYYFNTHPFR